MTLSVHRSRFMEASSSSCTRKSLVEPLNTRRMPIALNPAKHPRRLFDLQTLINYIIAMFWFRRKKHEPNKNPEDNRCSFCSKRRSKAEKLAAGPNTVYICNECLEACRHILADYEERAEKSFSDSSFAAEMACSFCLRNGSEVKYLIAGPTVYICGDCAVSLRQSLPGQSSQSAE